MDDGDNQKWMELLRDYMIDNHINHTFWCLNPNSGDTGGLLDSQFGEWDKDKYELFELSLWQTLDSGKYIGLDHKTALGANGLSLDDFYTNYAASEGSNINGGTKIGEDPTSSSTTSTTSGDVHYGDANCDGKVDLSDAVIILQAIANTDKYGVGGTDPTCITEEGVKNGDCSNVGDGITARDALAVQKFVIGLITLPEE